MLNEGIPSNLENYDNRSHIHVGRNKTALKLIFR